jgi:hypothetical protein
MNHNALLMNRNKGMGFLFLARNRSQEPEKGARVKTLLPHRLQGKNFGTKKVVFMLQLSR